MNVISQRKPAYPLSDELREYFRQQDRLVEDVISYESLLNWSDAVPLEDENGRDTLWLSVFYPPGLREEIHAKLVASYVRLRAKGADFLVQHLSVERVDYCSFGNSRPLRIRIVNRFNDNYDHFYVKQADASRLLGLELEHLLSPNRMDFFIEGNTLIEEHIAGIPGDRFILDHLQRETLNRVRLAKEFVKFDERCFLRLLGDMRAQNYVVNITPDFEGEQYRIRAIDFDQQCYEGRYQLYMPHRWDNNHAVRDFCIRLLNIDAIRQYQYEERALLHRRMKEDQTRVDQLLAILKVSTVSTAEKIQELAEGLAVFHGTDKMLAMKTMGDILELHLKICLRRT